MDKFLSKNIPQNDTESKLAEYSVESVYHKANKAIFGNDNFRSQQFNIVKSIMENKDVFVIMPTGGGKSLCYALPAVLSKGVTVVISPLISLIEDQVSAFIQLPSGGIPSAYLTSTCTDVMARSIFADLARSNSGREPYLKLLYVTPERIVKGLGTRDVLNDLYQNEMLARFVIDEAHCVSSWGHDFRKEYGQLGLLKKEFPDVPIVALTATARKKVADDVVKSLGIPQCTKFNTGFDRPNLFFEVREKPVRQEETFKHMLQYIQTAFPTSTGIVYCMTKKDCEHTADYLRANKIAADYYHAGQTKGDRKTVQCAWLQGRIKVVCATIAYGMGIDMPTVRYVIHLSLAKSLEGYYQEAGRAGRDGLPSECLIYYRPSDVDALMRIMKSPPSFKVSKRDTELLHEMEAYCETRLNCRRKEFHDKFTESERDFRACGDQCDNCLAKRGRARRAYVDPEATSYGGLQLTSSSAGKGTGRVFVSARSMIDMSGTSESSSSSLSGTRDVLSHTAWVDGTVRRPVFQKASDIRNNSILSIKNNNHTTVDGNRSSSVGGFRSASNTAGKVVDLMDDADENAWISTVGEPSTQSKKRKLPVY